MRTHYPNSKIYGFQSFLYYPHLLNQSPTLLEDKLKLIPNKIIVTSKIAKSSRKEFHKKGQCNTRPKFRKQKIFEKIKLSQNINLFLLFVVLNLSMKKFYLG